jgi:hypothetical protein
MAVVTLAPFANRTITVAVAGGFVGRHVAPVD